jgi:hypothetical protein
MCDMCETAVALQQQQQQQQDEGVAAPLLVVGRHHPTLSNTVVKCESDMGTVRSVVR